jgi:hypothetical protein
MLVKLTPVVPNTVKIYLYIKEENNLVFLFSKRKISQRVNAKKGLRKKTF